MEIKRNKNTPEPVKFATFQTNSEKLHQGFKSSSKHQTSKLSTLHQSTILQVCSVIIFWKEEQNKEATKLVA